MDMKDIKLVLLDMDGTLVNSQGVIPNDFYQVVQDLKAKGVRVGIASGRHFQQLQFPLHDMLDQLICICQNGSAIYQNQNCIYQHGFDQDVAFKILDHALTIPDSFIQIFGFDGIYSNLNDQKKVDFLKSVGFEFTYLQDIKSYQKQIANISVVSNDGSDLRDYFLESKDYVLLPSGYGYLDICPDGVSKASGAQHLCDLLDIDITQVMAIGDEENDLALLKSVGEPVAMKNAVKTVKDIASYVTDYDNEHDGCVRFLKQYFQL